MQLWTTGRRDALLIAAAVLPAFALRTWHTGFNFDGDEIFSVTLANDSFVHVITRSLADTPHPPLYNILLHCWISLFGASEPAVRTLSILFSCGAIVFLYRIMRRYADAWTAYAVALLAAFSPLLLYYGQQARPYALIMLMSAANLYAFLKTLDAPGHKQPLAAWTATGTGLLLSHYIGVLFLGFQFIWVLIERRPQARRYILAALPAVGLLALWVATAFSAKAGANPVPQIGWMGKPHLLDFAWFYIMTFGARLRSVWLIAILAVLAIWYTRRTAFGRQLPDQHLLFLLLAVGLPLTVFAVSIWGPQAVFADRQLVGAALATLIVVGLAASTLPRWAGGALLLCLIGWSAMHARMAQPDIVTPPWRESARWIEQHYPSAPLLANEPFCDTGLAYYHHEGRLALWHDQRDTPKSDTFLFACRPATCAAATQTFSQAKLVKTWRWDRDTHATAYNQMRLYAVAPSPTRQAGSWPGRKKAP